MLKYAILLLILVSNFNESHANSNILRFDDYTIALYEKVMSNPDARSQFELDKLQAKWSEEYYKNPKLSVTYEIIGGKETVVKNFSNENDYLTFKKETYLAKFRQNEYGRHSLDLINNIVPYGLVGIAENVITNEAERNRVYNPDANSTEDILTLMQFSKDIDYIRHVQKNSDSLSKFLLTERKINKKDLIANSSLVRQANLIRQSESADSAIQSVNGQVLELEHIVREFLNKEYEKEYENKKMDKLKEEALSIQNIGSLLMSINNPEFQKIGQGVIGVSKGYELIGKLALDKSLTPMATLNVYLGLANIVAGLVSSSGDGLESAVKAILEAIENLRKEMHVRFDGIERMLTNLGYKIDGLESLANLSIYKLNQIMNILEKQELERIISDENKTLDAIGINELVYECEKFLNTNGFLGREQIHLLEKNCYNKLAKVLLKTSYDSSISTPIDSFLREKLIQGEDDLVKKLYTTNKYGNLNLLISYSKNIISHSVSREANLRKIKKDYPGVFEEIKYPNIKIFMVMSSLFERSYQRFGINFKDYSVLESAILENNPARFDNYSNVQEKKQKLVAAMNFLNKSGVRLVINKLLERQISLFSKFLVNLKGQYFERHTFINIDKPTVFKPDFIFSDELHLKDKFNIIENEIIRLKNLNIAENDFVNKNPWPQDSIPQTQSFQDMIRILNSNIDKEKPQNASFQFYVTKLREFIFKTYPGMQNKLLISYKAVSADRRTVLTDLIKQNCVPGLNSSHVDKIDGMGRIVGINSSLREQLFDPQYGWCVHHNATTNGVKVWLSLSPLNDKSFKKEIQFNLNPKFMFLDDRHLHHEKHGKMLEMYFEESKEIIRASVDRALREYAITAREDFIQRLTELNAVKVSVSNEPSESICNKLTIQSLENLDFDASKNQLCELLIDKNKTLKLSKDIIDVYAFDKTLNSFSSRLYRKMMDSIEMTAVSPKDLHSVYGITRPVTKGRGR